MLLQTVYVNCMQFLHVFSICLASFHWFNRDNFDQKPLVYTAALWTCQVTINWNELRVDNLYQLHWNYPLCIKLKFPYDEHFLTSFCLNCHKPMVYISILCIMVPAIWVHLVFMNISSQLSLQIKILNEMSYSFLFL